MAAAVKNEAQTTMSMEENGTARKMGESNINKLEGLRVDGEGAAATSRRGGEWRGSSEAEGLSGREKGVNKQGIGEWGGDFRN